MGLYVTPGVTEPGGNVATDRSGLGSFSDVGPPGGRVIRRAFRAATRRAPAERTLVSAVVVAGQGYVGLPLAMRAVAAGHEVTGYDIDQSG